MALHVRHGIVRNAQPDHAAAERTHQRAERVAVRIVDFAGSQRIGHIEQFVTRREQRDFWPPDHRYMCDP